MTAWQMEISAELMGLHDSLDNHVNPEDVAAKLYEMATALLKLPAVLNGETATPEEERQITTAEEFAAMWNTRTPEQRQALVRQLLHQQKVSQDCFLQDHDVLKEQLREAQLRIIELQLARPAAPRWEVTYAHEDCEQCEDCAEQAIRLATEHGLTEERWREMIPGPDGYPVVGHLATVKRL
jgi:hypothetical protein